METVYHCAYCLTELPFLNVKKCGKCHKRVYCSKECQVSDWKPNIHGDPLQQRGQGHKNWCGIDYGEEDVDWKVAPVEGKGFGVIALRDIPSRFRIMVDACQLTPYSHSATDDLMPKNGSPEEKFQLNSLDVHKDDETVGGDKGVLCLRLARVNHSCISNASHMCCITTGVKILFSERDISAGEEITISYTTWNDITQNDMLPDGMNRFILRRNWGIECTDDCKCLDTEILAWIKRCREMDTKILTLGAMRQPERALVGVKRLLSNYHIFGGSLLNRKRTLYDGFQIGILSRKTLNEGIDYLRQRHDIVSRIYHPKSDEAQRCDELLKNPSSHRNYLLL